MNGAPAATVNQQSTDLTDWVPMPRYLLRCWVVKRLIKEINPKSFIEIGAASGHMSDWLSQQDMRGIAVEISSSALSMLRQRCGHNPRVQIFQHDAAKLTAKTDLLLSMEVLEHIEDDNAALQNWYDLIRPGGHMILSVPARQHLFSAEDEMAGHFRRYEKNGLLKQLSATGFEDLKILSYGFPLGLILKRMRTYVANQNLGVDNRDRQQRTEASGVERKRWAGWRWLLNDICFLPFHWLQMPFLNFDCSDGYIAIAQKPESENADER